MVKRLLSNCYKSHCFHRLSGVRPTPQKTAKEALFVLQTIGILWWQISIKGRAQANVFLLWDNVSGSESRLLLTILWKLIWKTTQNAVCTPIEMLFHNCLKYLLCMHYHNLSVRQPGASLKQIFAFLERSISTKHIALPERITCPPFLNDKRRFINADAAGSNMKWCDIHWVP